MIKRPWPCSRRDQDFVFRIRESEGLTRWAHSLDTMCEFTASVKSTKVRRQHLRPTAIINFPGLGGSKAGFVQCSLNNHGRHTGTASRHNWLARVDTLTLKKLL